MEEKDWSTWYDLNDNWQEYVKREALQKRNDGRKPKNKQRVKDMTIMPTIHTRTTLADEIIKREQEEEMWNNAPPVLKCIGQLKYNWVWPSIEDDLDDDDLWF